MGCKAKMRTAIITEDKAGARATKRGMTNGRKCNWEATGHKVWEQGVKRNNERLNIERGMRKYYSLQKCRVQERGKYHGNIR